MAYEFKSDKETIKYIVRTIARLPTVKKRDWVKKDTVVLSDADGKELGRIYLDADGVKITGRTICGEAEKIHLEAVKTLSENLVSDTEINASIFDTPIEGIKKNKLLFDKLQKDLKDFGISKVIINKDIREENITSPDVVLYLKPSGIKDTFRENLESGYIGKLRTFIHSGYYPNLESPDLITVSVCGYKLRKFQTEQIVTLKIKDMEIGVYYPERNIVVIYFNPFDHEIISPFMKGYSPLLKDIVSLLKLVQIKKYDVTTFQQKLFLDGFVSRSRSRIRDVKNTQESLQRDWTNAQQNERNIYNNFIANKQEVEYLEQVLESEGTILFKEIAETKKLPFIDSVKLKGTEIVVTLQEGTIKFKTYKRRSINFGLRTVYMGKLSLHIAPTQLRVTSDYRTTDGNPHTHASSDGSPCFGDGELRKQLNTALAESKISTVAKTFYFWTKTHNENDSHMKKSDFLKDRLKQGLPVWDEKGERVIIDDKARVESGEITQDLSKNDNYEDNIKKFKDMKCF